MAASLPAGDSILLQEAEGHSMNSPMTVLISSRNRPLYLWACLDSLYRNTKYPCRFILLDVGSDDPMVTRVIEGFRRREMFDEVIFAPQNDPSVVADLVMHRLEAWAPYFVYVESDVVVEETTPCWLEQMVSLMDSHPKLAMLGSAIDRRDFVDPARAAQLFGDIEPGRLYALIKAGSPERQQNLSEALGEPMFRPHNPAGRLLMLRTEPIRELGGGEDAAMDHVLRQAGYETAIATGVRHRHLSLLQVFDYPGYDLDSRNAYMTGLNHFRD